MLNNDVNTPDNETNKNTNKKTQQITPQNEQTRSGNIIPADPIMHIWPTTLSQAFFDHERNVKYIDRHV